MLLRKEKTFYAVTFMFEGRKMFAHYGKKPTGIFPPEPRCIFNDRKKAERLKKFIEEESTFSNIRIEDKIVR